MLDFQLGTINENNNWYKYSDNWPKHINAEKRKSDEKAHLGSPAKKPNLKYTNIKEFWTSLGSQNYTKNGALSENDLEVQEKTYVRRKVKVPWTENLCSSTIFSFDLVTTYPLYRDQVSKRDKKYIDNSDNFTI